MLAWDRKNKGRMTKRGTPPPKKKTLTKRGTLLFVDREVFDVHVVVGINPTAQQDVCASTVHFSSCIHHHYQNSQCPTGCGMSTLLFTNSLQVTIKTNLLAELKHLSSSQSQTCVRVTYIYIYYICVPRACVSSKKGLIILRAY